jgi:hypothetical protein
MAICLGINDDIIKLFRRYDELKAKKKPEPFLSSFHTDYIAYNLNYSENNNQIIKSGGKDKEVPKKDNANLIDFDFVGGNSNSESTNQINPNIQGYFSFGDNPKPNTGKTSDINDIFNLK